MVFRCLPALVVFSTLLSALPAVPRAHAQADTPVVHAVLFNSPMCTFCHEIVDKELPSILQKYGDQLVILIVDVDTKPGRALYDTAVGIYKVNGVPLMIIGDVVLNGTNIPKELPGIVDDYLAQGGVGWPEIPGLEEYRNTVAPTATATITSTITPITTVPTPSPTVTPSLSGPPTQGGDSQAVVRFLLFISPTCGHCHVVQNQILPPLQEKYGAQLQIFTLDTYTQEGYALYQEVISKFGLERAGVPLLVIGDRYLVGSKDIPEQLPGLIDFHLARGGVDWPALSGLEEALEAAEKQTDPVSPLVSGWFARVRDNVARDPVGNSLSIVILIGMIAALGAAGVYARRPSVPSPSRMPAWVIPGLCLIGLVVAGYLSYVEVGGVEAVCGPVGDCNTVQTSSYARLFGILPIGVLGVFGYLAILATWTLGRISRGNRAVLADLAILGMAAFGFLFSIYLTFLEPFVIGASCMWCHSSAILMTTLFWFSLRPGLAAIRTLAPDLV